MNEIRNVWVMGGIASVLLFSLCSAWAGAEKNRWVYFCKDKNQAGVKYFYDSETVEYLPDSRVRVWLKVAKSSEDQVLHTEIDCSGGLFTVVRHPKEFDIWRWRTETDKSKYMPGRWHEIPPDSEVHLLGKILCNDPGNDHTTR
jgi:hypothetical protein